MLQRLRDVRSEIQIPDEAEIWDLRSENAGQAFSALSSETAREVLALLYDSPRSASELADELDQSLQNVKYHLQNLIDAELVEVGDTEYSQKGHEMKVYVPTRNAVLLLAQESTAGRIRRLLATIIAGIAITAIGAILFRSLVVDGLVDIPGIEVEKLANGDADHDADGVTEPETIVEIINPLEHLPLLLDPGVTFFLGAMFAVLVIIGMWWLVPRTGSHSLFK